MYWKLHNYKHSFVYSCGNFRGYISLVLFTRKIKTLNWIYFKAFPVSEYPRVLRVNRLRLHLAINLVLPTHTSQQVQGSPDLVYVRHVLIAALTFTCNIILQHAFFWRKTWCTRRQSDWTNLSTYFYILQKLSFRRQKKIIRAPDILQYSCDPKWQVSWAQWTWI